MILIGAAAAVAAAGIVVAGTGTNPGAEGEVYDLPLAQAQAELSAAPLPLEIGNAYRKTLGENFQAEQGADGNIVWRFTHQGVELARFTAMLTDEGSGKTRISVDFKPSALLREKEELLFNPMVANAAEMMVAEHIDSALEHRPFDEARVKAAVTAYAAIHPDEVESIEPRQRPGKPDAGGWSTGSDDAEPDAAAVAEASNAAAEALAEYR
jgi:hypothetical protein